MAKIRFRWPGKKQANKRKMSETMLAYAQGYFSLATNATEKQSMLNLACNAWNIATFPENEREREIKYCIEEYKEANPGIDDTSDLEHDLRKLVHRKLVYFSADKRRVVKAESVMKEGKELLYVASIDTDD